MSELRVMESARDMERVVALGEQFWAVGPYAGRGYGAFNADDLRATLHHMRDNPLAVVFLTDHAMIGGLLSPLFFNRQHLIAHEAFWFSEPGSRDGQRVRRAFERWAFTAGAAEVQMTCLADSHEKRMRTILQKRQGYRALEVSLVKGAPWLSEAAQQS